jgi:hypothetical protein
MIVTFMNYVRHQTGGEINLSGPVFKYYLNVSLELLRKTMKTLLSTASRRADFRLGVF